MSASDLPSLRQFLSAYREEVLLPIEMAAILRSRHHASRSETRELIRLDVALGGEPRLADFAAASHAVGRSRLRRLLPLRDQRLVQRYWCAVEAGRAHAWHPVVYGVVLALFYLPVRQGLANYAHQTLHGFAQAAAGRIRLNRTDLDRIDAELCAQLPALVARALAASESAAPSPCTLQLPSSTRPIGQ